MYNNIILDKLPLYTPDGLKIRTNFRESIKFELLMQDRNVSDEDKIKMALNLYYCEPQKIQNIEQAIKNILWFYKCGKEDKNVDKNNEENNIKNKQIYSYEFDAEYIYSAFMEQYNIDLNNIEYLHWWKFKALFLGLSEENVLFTKIMGYRAMNLSKIKDKEMKKHYKKMQKIYALPDMRSEEEKENDFAEAFS